MKINIKNICASCGKKMKNDKDNYERFGNFCPSCSTKIKTILEWRVADNAITELKQKNQTISTEIKLKRIIWRKEQASNMLWKRWKVDIEARQEKDEAFFENLKKLTK